MSDPDSSQVKSLSQRNREFLAEIKVSVEANACVRCGKDLSEIDPGWHLAACVKSSR